MPLYGGVCPYDPEHAPIPDDMTDPDIPEWYASWLHNYLMRDRWPFPTFSATPAIPDVILGIAPSQAMSFLVEDLEAADCEVGLVEAADRWKFFFAEQELGVRDLLQCAKPVDASPAVGRRGKSGGRGATRASSQELTVNSAALPPRLEEEAALDVPVPHGRGRGRGRGSGLEARPGVQSRVDTSRLPRAPRDWLLEVDDTGCLDVYNEAISQLLVTPAELVEGYARQGPDGRWNRLSPDFYTALGVKKLGHKRLFEKWFNETL